jgi:hypothetical protein
MPNREQTPAVRDTPPRELLAIAVGAGLAAAIVVLVIAYARSRPEPPGPLTIPAVSVPQADTPECQTLISSLPQRLGDYERAEISNPVPPGTAAWRPQKGNEAILLRCGVARPAESASGTPVQVGNVQWFGVAEQNTGRKTWFVVDRAVYIALTLPQGTGATPIQQISEIVAARLPAVPVQTPAP